MRRFGAKLDEALFALDHVMGEDENQLAKNAQLNQLATTMTGPGAKAQQNQQPAKQQQNNAAQKKAEQLYQQYQLAKREADKAEQDAMGKQDPALFNKAASARKRMEETYKAYQLAQQQALGQGGGDVKKVGMPPEAAAGAVARQS